MKSLWVCYWYVKMPGKMDLEYITFSVQKQFGPLALWSSPPLLRDGPPAFVRLAYCEW